MRCYVDRLEGSMKGEKEGQAILFRAVSFLIVLAIIGSGLSGVSIGSYVLFPYRIYLPMFFLFVIYYISKYRSRIVTTSAAMLVAMFFIYILGSFFWTPMSEENISSLFILSTSFALLASIYYAILGEKQVSGLIQVISIITVVTMLLALIESATQYHFPASGLNHLPDRPPFSAWSSVWFYNPNDLSYYLSLTTPIFLVNSINSYLNTGILKDSWINGKFLLNSFSLAGCIMVIVRNGSRAAIISTVLISILIIVIYTSRHLKLIENYNYNFMTVAGLVAIPVILIVPLVVANPFDNTTQTSLWIRWRLFVEGVQIVYHTPWGVGVGEFVGVLRSSSTHTNGVYSPHNWIVFLLAEYGLLGTFLFITALGKMLDQHLHDFMSDGDSISLIGFGSLFVFVLGGVGPSNVMLLKPTWIFLGISLIVIRNRKK